MRQWSFVYFCRFRTLLCKPIIINIYRITFQLQNGKCYKPQYWRSSTIIRKNEVPTKLFQSLHGSLFLLSSSFRNNFLKIVDIPLKKSVKKGNTYPSNAWILVIPGKIFPLIYRLGCFEKLLATQQWITVRNFRLAQGIFLVII